MGYDTIFTIKQHLIYAMKPAFKDSPSEFNQHQLFPSNVFNLLDDDHECYLYHDLFQQLDTGEVEKQYSLLGQRAYHPRLVISILIYAYSRGVFSSREIERRCHEDLSFMYIAQMNCPNFRVLSDFRKDHHDFFKACFKQTVQLAIELKLASLGHISLDGSKFKANSSKHKAMSYRNLKKQEQALTQEIDGLIRKAEGCDKEEDRDYGDKSGYELPEELEHKQKRLKKIQEAKAALEAREEALRPGKPIDDRKQISFADHDANIMGKKGDFDYRYNGQISVDSDNQIIIGEHVSQKANDQQEVQQGLEAIKETAGQYPDKASLDNGYLSGENLKALEEAGIDAYVATHKGEKKNAVPLEESTRRLVKSDFEYNEADNTFTCPNGQVLEMIREDKNGRRIYQGDIKNCEGCAWRERCSQSGKGEARTVTGDQNEALRQQMNRKMEEPTSKEIYKQRKVIVEPAIGHIKNGGFTGFSVRGLDKVAGEFSLVCTVHNIKKFVGAAIKGLVRPEKGKWVANPAR